MRTVIMKVNIFLRVLVAIRGRKSDPIKNKEIHCI